MTISAHPARHQSGGSPPGHRFVPRMSLTTRGCTSVTLLALDDLHLSFGGVAALAGVSLAVDAGAFFAVIGPNGAGKTSIFNCISGIYAPTRGRIMFDGHDISHLRSHRRAGAGGPPTLQNTAPFRGATAPDKEKIRPPLHPKARAPGCRAYDGRGARGTRAPSPTPQ